MNDNTKEITITITVTGDFGGGNIAHEVKVAAKSEYDAKILLRKAAEFIRKEAGNSY